jgi:penicillin-binding protein 1A
MSGFSASFAWYLWDDGVFGSESEQISKITSAIVPESTIVFDRNNEKIGEYYNLYHEFVPFEEIPKGMISALIAIEDRRFFEHKGVNWTSIGRAFLSLVTSGKLKQGGSTLTMQLVKNYLLTREKKVSRKVREIILSYYVEKNLSKERILELYLNTMFMGHGAYGVGAASRTFFGKPLSELKTHEFALLAGLFQAPSSYNPHKNPELAIKRQKVVLTAMLNSGAISTAEAEFSKRQPLEFKPWTPLNQTVAPLYLEWVRQLVNENLGEEADSFNDRGLKIYTSLDKNLQLIANNSIQKNTSQLLALQSQLRLKKDDRVEASLLSLDYKNGAVLAMVGGRDFRESQFNRAVDASRSPGSAFKPVVYSLAFEKGMSWGDMIYVTPLNVGGYKPKNHEGDDFTEVTLLKAFARSMNTPVVSMAQKFGIESVRERALKMGVLSEMPKELGVALGGFSATIMDIARLYSVIANQGSLHVTWTLRKITDRDDKVLFERSTATPVPDEVFSPTIAALLRSGLQSVLTIGTGSALSDMSSYAAGKTGTSDDSRDNWFCGFTNDFVAITWVGTDLHGAMGKASSGSSLALPIWESFTREATDRVYPPRPWSTPEGLTLVQIDPDYGTPSPTGVSALFLDGKLPVSNQASEDMKTIKQDQKGYREMKIDD